jgi:ubiquinone/menaquinone biosynthesis C-methylase UbiE
MSYGSQQFWDQRYRESKEECEWYYSLEVLAPILSAAGLMSPSRVLEIGCGDAPLLTGMSAHEGRLVGIDFSGEVVARLKQEADMAEGSHVEFLQMDARKLSFDDNSFDFVIDKGTTDAMLCGKSGPRNIRRIFSEVVRVLSPGGCFVLVSHMEFSSDEMQGLISSVILPILDNDRTLRWALHAYEAEEGKAATVYTFQCKRKRFTRSMLEQPCSLPTTISTFEV